MTNPKPIQFSVPRKPAPSKPMIKINSNPSSLKSKDQFYRDSPPFLPHLPRPSSHARTRSRPPLATVLTHDIFCHRLQRTTACCNPTEHRWCTSFVAAGEAPLPDRPDAALAATHASAAPLYFLPPTMLAMVTGKARSVI